VRRGDGVWASHNPGKAIFPEVPRAGVEKGEVVLDVGWSFPLITGFTPIIRPRSHLSVTFGMVEGGMCSSGEIVCPDDRAGGWGEGDLDRDSEIGVGWW
jgi:hypothetical protein